MTFFIASGLFCAVAGFWAGIKLGDRRLEAHRAHVAFVLQRKELTR